MSPASQAESIFIHGPSEVAGVTGYEVPCEPHWSKMGGGGGRPFTQAGGVLAPGSDAYTHTCAEAAASSVHASWSGRVGESAPLQDCFHPPSHVSSAPSFHSHPLCYLYVFNQA